MAKKASEPLDLDTALSTIRDLQALAKAANANGGTVPNGIKVISGLVLGLVSSAELSIAAVSAMQSVLAGVPHAPALLRLEGGVKACVSILVHHSDKAKVVGGTVKVLGRACSNSQMTAVSFLKEKGGLDHLLRCIGGHLGDHAVVAPVCDLLVGLSRHEKSAKLLPAGEVACALRDVLVGYLGRWDVCSSSLRVLKNLSKCEEARLTLLRSTECTKLLLGVSRILARLPERRKLFKRAYRTLWLLFGGLLPELPGPDVDPEEDIFGSQDTNLTDEEADYSVFPESTASPHDDVKEVPMEEGTKVRPAAVPPNELPTAEACRTDVASDPDLSAFHSDGEVLVARAMLHELERIMHPSRTLHTHVYDDFNGPTPAGPAFSDPKPLGGAKGARTRGAGRAGAPPGVSATSSSVCAVAAASTAAALEGKPRVGEGEASTPAFNQKGMSDDGPERSTPPLIFESRFESGNLRKAVRVYNREYDLHLAPDLTDPDARCQWFYFSVEGAVSSVPYKFNVVNLGKKDSLYNAGMRPLLCRMEAADVPPGGAEGAAALRAMARDEHHWMRGGEDVCYYPTPYRSYPPSAVRPNPAGPPRKAKPAKRKKNKSDDEVGKNCGGGLWGATFTVQLDSKAKFYLAMCYPYTYSDLQLYLSRMLRGSGALRNGALASDICRRGLLCQTLKGNRVDCLTVTDFLSLGEGGAEGAVSGVDGAMLDRPYVVVSARVHPGETNASWMMKGVLDFLLGPSPLAARLRRTYVFKCVPMLNPDGVINGNYRCSLAGCDLNRQWANPSKKWHPPVYYMKRMIDRVAKSGRLVLFCDLHGHSRKEDVFIYGCEPLRGSGAGGAGGEDGADGRREEAEARARVRLLPFLISKHNPAFVMRKCSFKVSKGKMGTGRVVVGRELGVPNSYTIEASFSGASCTGRHMHARDFEDMGGAFCTALSEATDAIEVSMDAEMELLREVDRHCGLGLTSLQNGEKGGDGNNSGNSDADSGDEE